MANNKKFTTSEKYNKHFTEEERKKIKNIIEDNRDASGALTISLKSIGEMLQKDPTTISKEVKKHRVNKDIAQSFYSRSCINYSKCENKHLCKIGNCNKYCKKCSDCYKFCGEYQERVCSKIKKFPWVCNGCNKSHGCHLRKYYYYPDKAQEIYKETLKTSREGINVKQEEFEAMDNIVYKGLVDNKQPLSHIFYANANLFPVSLRTLYFYFDKGYFKAKNIDLPRKVKYKRREYKHQKGVVYRKNKIGRTYEDYQIFMNDNPNASVVQMDTVEGIKGGKLLLTFHFVKFKFQLAYLVDSKEAINTVNVLNHLYTLLGHNLFTKLFNVILTDNGTEFSMVNEMEMTSENIKRCSVFFCTPYSSYQKGACEKNHEYIRMALPKGTSFDSLNQDKIDLIMSNINSIIRPKEKCSPFDRFNLEYGSDVLDLLKIKKIDSNDVKLTHN